MLGIEKMITISDEITKFLHEKGASLIGFADLTVLPAEVRLNLPRAVVFAVALAPNIVAFLREGPTKEYHSEYERAKWDTRRTKHLAYGTASGSRIYSNQFCSNKRRH